MHNAYRELLEAAIQHLEELRADGERWVNVSPGLLSNLTRVDRKQSAVGVRSVSRITNRSDAGASSPVASSTTPDTSLVAKATHSQTAEIPPVTPIEINPPKALPEQDKSVAMAQLQEKVLACQKCPHLVRARRSVVFGVGDIHAQLMFVGEAPGADEDRQGEPFVGAAGQLLNRVIKTMGFSRESVYIANVLKCRPDTPGQTSGNRKPVPEEMRTCLPYLQEQIRLIQPKVIVALGGTAMEGLFGKPVTITRTRGRWQFLGSIPVMPTYHPSYLLRNQVLSVRREVWEDMLQVLEKLEVPISEAQRGYFKTASD